jgi:hypothetical protein
MNWLGLVDFETPFSRLSIRFFTLLFGGLFLIHCIFPSSLSLVSQRVQHIHMIKQPRTGEKFLCQVAFSFHQLRRTDKFIKLNFHISFFFFQHFHKWIKAKGFVSGGEPNGFMFSMKHQK